VSVNQGDASLIFELVDGTLKTTTDVNAYGAEGLTLYRFDVLVTSLYPVVGSGSQGLSLDQLKNASYSGIYDEPVTLTDGSYEGEPFVEGGAQVPTVTWVNNGVAYGDLNGDGVDDAAVLLVENSGGTGVFTYVGVQLNVDGQPVDAGTAWVGDRTQAKSMAIENGQVIMEIVTQGPSDPQCCPTLKVRKIYALQDGKPVEVSSEEMGSVSLDELMGTSWVLEDLNFDQQPVLPDTEISATFADSQVSGSAGCNNYNASVSDESPDGGENNSQTLTVGPVISTQMACAEPVMDQELEYLTALQGVTQWYYLPARLALSYQTPEGEFGTLVFEPAPAE
jgi:heat shock protein HslJ